MTQFRHISASFQNLIVSGSIFVQPGYFMDGTASFAVSCSYVSGSSTGTNESSSYALTSSYADSTRGSSIFVSATAPPNPQVNDIWIKI
jgi:hypothetical protein